MKLAGFFLSMIFALATADERCVTHGRFPSPDPTCRDYFLCVQHGDSFIVKSYKCPESAVFNPVTSRCSVNSHCEHNICRFVPPNVKRISDPDHDDCKTFIECVGPPDARIPIVKRCEIGYFNKDLLPEPGCCFIKNC